MRQLPVTKGAFAAVALVLVTGIGGYFALVAPKARAIAQLDLQLKTAPVPTEPPVMSTVSISDAERSLWSELETRVHARFVAPDDQLRALGEVMEQARATGLTVSELGIVNAQAQAVQSPLTSSANLTVNPGVIRLTARHRYPELVAFLDGIRRGRRYVAVQGLTVRRVDDHLESEILLVSLRWKS